MDTQHLQAFCAVARLQSFSQAADSLFLTQPAISKRIALLEQQLGYPLFDRIGRQVSLTPAGKVLLPQAQMMLRHIENTQRLIDNLDQAVNGQLSLATSHHIGLHRLPQLLKQYTHTYPDVHLDLHFLDSEKAYQEIQDGRHDIAVVTLAPNTPDTIAQHPIWQDKLVFVVSQEHPLATISQIGLKDLSQHTGILPDKNTYTTRLIQTLFDQQQIPLEIKMATNHLESIKMMVSVGMGWGVLPASMVDSQVIELSVRDIQVSRQLGYIHHHQRTLSQATQAFIQLLLSDHKS